MTLEWTKQTWNLEVLRQWANSASAMEVGAMNLLYSVGVIPQEVKWTRKNRIPRIGIDPSALPAEYLAEVAYEWDSDGLYHPTEFIEMLEYEVAGPHRDAITRTLTNLGKPNGEFEASESSGIKFPAKPNASYPNRGQEHAKRYF